MYWVSEFALLLSLLQQLIRYILHSNFIVCRLEYQIVWAAGHYDTCTYVCVCVLEGGEGGRKGEREEEDSEEREGGGGRDACLELQFSLSCMKLNMFIDIVEPAGEGEGRTE